MCLFMTCDDVQQNKGGLAFELYPCSKVGIHSRDDSLKHPWFS